MSPAAHRQDRALRPDRPTYVVILTPPGRGAVATLVVEGPSAIEAVVKRFRPAARGKALFDFPQGRIVFGRWGGAAGEEIVVVRTADEQLELNCHGGLVAAERLRDDLVQAGCVAIEWPQWLRAYPPAGGVIEIEAHLALAEARTQRVAGILLDQLQGALSEELAHIRQLATGDPAHAAERLRVLRERASLGLHLTTPWRIVLAGRPNVGKSSLINALVGYQRAIVFDQPGTTRDVVTAATAIDGWPVELADTAGLRTGGDELEAAGIARAREQMSTADLLVLVFDLTQPWTEEDTALVNEWPQALVVHNKCDSVGRSLRDRQRVSEKPAYTGRPAGLLTSAATQQGIDELLAILGRRLVANPPPPGSAVPFTDRQIELLAEAERRCRLSG